MKLRPGAVQTMFKHKVYDVINLDGTTVSLKDTVALQMLYFLKIKIFISLDSCQFVEYLFKIKIYIFQFLKTKKGDNVSFVYFYKITFV